LEQTDIEKAIRERHSVRQYTSRKIEGETLQKLQSEIDRVNAESGMRIRLVLDEPKAFSGFMLKALVNFKGAVNYLAIIGPESDHLNLDAGYWGEQLVLYAQHLGLNTCWAMMAKKEADKDLEKGYRTVISISIGYGENPGQPHKSKPAEKVADLDGAPEWFLRGVEFALLAPTGINRQGFRFARDGNKVTLTGGSNTLGQIDLGIVKYHFECGAGIDNFEWA
jgi:nitroreductase